MTDHRSQQGHDSPGLFHFHHDSAENLKKESERTLKGIIRGVKHFYDFAKADAPTQKHQQWKR